eukprot:TRINITY_DN15049_c0_g1_i1.p1 TRINITY_DN15049_c0_g1~~TRINITY_DN15049_c0_g1_i1.p1  ORF type:complete len:612 (+),score=99.10 TRINITY_DN15049_c0_g1_i1:82-1917(+)
MLRARSVWKLARTGIAAPRSRSRALRNASLWAAAGISCFLFLAALAPSDTLGLTEDLHRRLGKIPPDDALIDQPYGEASNRWLVFFHVIGIAYMLLGLNTVCDLYFTGALDVMVERWNIKPDVAGATFMAAGGSAPELFTSLMGACVTESDVGISTIVGSAVFNVLFVIGLCGFASEEVMLLTWWPLFRDCSFYIVGLSFLAGFAKDGQVHAWEAAILFILYLLYLLFMYHNSKLEEFTDRDFMKARSESPQQKARAVTADLEVKLDRIVPIPMQGADEDFRGTAREITVVTSGVPSEFADEMAVISTGETPPAPVRVENNFMSPASDDSMPSHLDVSSRNNSAATSAAGNSRRSTKTCHGKVHAAMFSAQNAAQRKDERMAAVGLTTTTPAVEVESSPGDEEEEDGIEELLVRPEGLKDQILWGLGLPVYAALYYGLPKPTEKWFVATFCLSLIWIAGLTFFLVWWTGILGEVLHIDIVIMSFTLLAAGTSIPDAVSSVAVARQGQGDMAVSSSVGSNIFDILVGLPIPWMLKILIVDHDPGSSITLNSEYLTFYVLVLLAMVLMVIISIHCLGWRLNKPLGACMAGLYVVFLATAVYVDTRRPEWARLG